MSLLCYSHCCAVVTVGPKFRPTFQTGECKYDFVEIMACPAGCVGGGGQPRSTDKQVTAKRQAALYNLDERSTIRR